MSLGAVLRETADWLPRSLFTRSYQRPTRPAHASNHDRQGIGLDRQGNFLVFPADSMAIGP